MTVVVGTGSLFDADVEALVNPVNTEGIMGAGLALEFKRRYPRNYLAYREACSHGEVRVGRMFIYQADVILARSVIFNFPTKERVAAPSRIGYIAAGLRDLQKCLLDREIKSVAIPALGCGLGGLDWTAVAPLILNTFSGLLLRAIVFEPKGEG